MTDTRLSKRKLTCQFCGCSEHFFPSVVHPQHVCSTHHRGAQTRQLHQRTLRNVHSYLHLLPSTFARLHDRARHLQRGHKSSCK